MRWAGEAASASSSSPGALDDNEVLLELKDVHKSFGNKKILRGVNMKIRRGEAVGIIGGSGTGKSTTLRLMAGLLAPDKVPAFPYSLKPHYYSLLGIICLIRSKCLQWYYILGNSVHFATGPSCFFLVPLADKGPAVWFVWWAG